MTTRAATLPSSMRGVLLGLILVALPAPCLSAGVALLTDLQGKATEASGGQRRDLTILAELQAGTQVQLAAGATLVALYLDAGEEYVFKGPATIVFRPTQPDVVTGAKPEKRGPPLGARGKDIRIKPVGVAQGALVMRGGAPGTRVQLLDLRRTRTLEMQPEFRWQALQPGAKYLFKLTDDAGGTLFQQQLAATALKLPASVRLKEEVPYTWEVSARLSDGRKYSGSAEFTLASAELRSQAEALRPADSAPVSQRIAYAAWLEQMELRDEARKYWQAVLVERPQDPRLRALGAN
jgi:hypothetical protein